MLKDESGHAFENCDLEKHLMVKPNKRKMLIFFQLKKNLNDFFLNFLYKCQK